MYFSDKTSHREIAREAGVCFKTLYRVLNNEAGVRPSTRDKVVSVLNRHGHFSHYSSKLKNVMILARQSNYLSLRVMELIRSLSPEFHCSIFNPQTDGIALFHALENTGFVVFYEKLSTEFENKLRDANPEIRIINVFGASGDLSIQIDELALGQLAADYLLQMGHQDIWVLIHREMLDSTSIHRSWSFHGRLLQNAPKAKIREIYVDRPEELEAFAYQESLPTAIWGPRWFETDYLCRYLHEHGVRIPQDVSVLSTDLPDELPPHQLDRIDCVYFKAAEVTKLIRYAILKQPLLQGIAHISMMTETGLRKVGSVQNIN